MVKYDVPFYPNPDESSCVPAVFKMILGYFLPNRQFSWEEINQLTGHVANKGTWYFTALTTLKQMGFDVASIDRLDYQRLFEEKEEYLKEYFDSKEVLRWTLSSTDLSAKLNLLPEFIQAVRTSQATPSLQDVERYLEDGYLVACEVDVGVLNNEEGFDDHLVLVVGFDKDNLIVHDPGAPPLPNREVNKQLFEKAWTFDGGKSKNLTAIRYNQKHDD